MRSATQVAGSNAPSAVAGTDPIVFVVDDDVSIRESLEALLRSAGHEPRVFASAREFLDAPLLVAPSCLVLDVTMPEMNGLDLQQLVAGRLHLPIIFVTGHGDVPMTVKAMKAGAVEFMTKPFSDDALLSAVAHALVRSHAILDRETELDEVRQRHASLTPREREVMALVVSGLLNKQVAGELGISEITVKAHRGQVTRKMKVRSLPALVKLAALLDRSAPPAPRPPCLPDHSVVTPR